MTAPVEGASAPSRRYAIYALALLTLINVVNYVERNAIFALFEPIKRDLGLTDTHLGWLGSAYVLVFSLAAFPVGVLSDLRGRTAMIATGVAVWSAFTSMAGLVRGFLTLVVTRAAVGMGGAAANAASTSVVADYFRGPRRAFAMGIFTAGLALGGILGILIAGQLEVIYGWRVTFLALGLPGFGLAVLAARLRDPARPAERVSVRAYLREVEVGLTALVRACLPLTICVIIGAVAAYLLDRRFGADSSLDVAAIGAAVVIGLVLNLPSWKRSASRHVTTTGGSRKSPMAMALDEMVWAFTTVVRTPTLVYVFVGGALISFGLNGIVGWAPSFMFRELGLSVGAASVLLGKWGLLAGLAGTLTGGLLADGLLRWIPTARMLTTAVGFLVGGPLAIWLLTIRDLDLFVPVFVAAFFFLTWYNGPLTAVIFDVVPARIGTTVVGAYLTFIHVAGDAIAFPLVGILSDRIGLERAVFILPIVGLAGGVVTLGGVRTLVRDMARVVG